MYFLLLDNVSFICVFLLKENKEPVKISKTSKGLNWLQT